jgi:hypothetical protein
LITTTHLDAQDPRSVLRIMDECGVELIVNITMRVGGEALEMLRKFHLAAKELLRLTAGWTGPTYSLQDSSNGPWTAWRNLLTTAHAV